MNPDVAQAQGFSVLGETPEERMSAYNRNPVVGQQPGTIENAITKNVQTDPFQQFGNYVGQAISGLPNSGLGQTVQAFEKNAIPALQYGVNSIPPFLKNLFAPQVHASEPASPSGEAINLSAPSWEWGGFRNLSNDQLWGIKQSIDSGQWRLPNTPEAKKYSDLINTAVDPQVAAASEAAKVKQLQATQDAASTAYWKANRLPFVPTSPQNNQQPPVMLPTQAINKYATADTWGDTGGFPMNDLRGIWNRLPSPVQAVLDAPSQVAQHMLNLIHSGGQ